MSKSQRQSATKVKPEPRPSRTQSVPPEPLRPTPTRWSKILFVVAAIAMTAWLAVLLVMVIKK